MTATGKTVVILGAGFGGLTAAVELRDRLGAGHRVILIDRSSTFRECAFNLSFMTGERSDPREVEGDLQRLAGGIEFVRDEVTRIDPTSRTVETSGQSWTADYLVVALGAQLVPEQIPGFSEAALNLYDPAAIPRLRSALEGLAGGRVAVLVSRTPFKCPAAPYEAAFLIEAMLRRRGVRERTEISLYTPEWAPMPVAGDAVGAELVRWLSARRIGYYPDHMVLAIDPPGTLHFEVDDAACDLLVGVPPHAAPKVVELSGLTDATGWVPVDPHTLATRFPGVFAVGDLASVRLRNGMFLPMAGIFAVQEGFVVASNIAAEIRGEPSRIPYDGQGSCYVEVGEGLAAYGAGNFYAAPAPAVRLESPTAQFKAAKDEFADSLLGSLRDAPPPPVPRRTAGSR